MRFRTARRVDVEPPSVVDGLRKCTVASLRAWKARVDDVEDKLVEIFSFELIRRSSRIFCSLT
jgi:hypothetical protein